MDEKKISSTRAIGKGKIAERREGRGFDAFP